MQDQIRKLNSEYSLDLTEDEIKLIMRQVEEADHFLEPLREMDLTDVMPILKFEKHQVKK